MLRKIQTCQVQHVFVMETTTSSVLNKFGMLDAASGTSEVKFNILEDQFAMRGKPPVK